MAFDPNGGPHGGGWLKLYRSIVDTAFWHDDWLVRLWVWCLVKANHSDASWRGIRVLRGEFVTGRNTAADELGVSPSKWMRGIMRLVDLGCIKYEANSNWTRLTVCNYTSYQDGSDEARTASGQVVTQRADNERTTSGQAVTQRADTREELKNERMEELKNGRKDTQPQAAGVGVDDSANARRAIDECGRRPPKPKEHPGFAAWYAIYPRKQAKPDAIRAYAKALTKIDADELEDATREYAVAVVGHVPADKIPYPATWLNGERWTDDRSTWRPQESHGGRASAFHQPGANFDPSRQPTALDPTIGSMD